MIKKGMKSKPKLISGRNIKGTDDGEDNRNKKSPKVKDTIPESSIIENTNEKTPQFVLWISDPTLLNMTKLRQAIRKCDTDWMKNFLIYGGLGLLLQCLLRLSLIQCEEKTHNLLKLEVISCIRCVANSKSGLECFLKLREQKGANYNSNDFAAALASNSVVVKLQIFEILSALCVYSEEGLSFTLDTLEQCKVQRKKSSRFSMIITEINKHNLTSYRTVLVTFVNSIIAGVHNIMDRVNIRNEFLSAKILKILRKLRNEDNDLCLQEHLNIFEDEMTSDNDAIKEIVAVEGVDVTQPKAMFEALYDKVQNTPLAISLQSILFDIYQMEMQNPNSDKAWNLLQNTTRMAVEHASQANEAHEEKNQLSSNMQEKSTQTDRLASNCESMTNNATVSQPIDFVSYLEEPIDSDLLNAHGMLMSSIVNEECKLLKKSHFENAVVGEDDRYPSSENNEGKHEILPQMYPVSQEIINSPRSLSSTIDEVGMVETIPPPLSNDNIPEPPLLPPTTPLDINGAEPPPPPPPPPPQFPGGGPPPPPPPFLLPGGGLAPPPPGGQLLNQKCLNPEVPLISMPKSNTRLKTFMWAKLPMMSVKKGSLWGEISQMEDKIVVEYGTFDELFAKDTTVMSKEAKNLGEKQYKKAPTEVMLLESKRSMNINIFLRQFKKENDSILSMVRNGEFIQIGEEKLKGLQSLLPTDHEIKLLKGYDEEIKKLGNAEKFMLGLLSLTNYQLRLEAMTFCLEFSVKLDEIRRMTSLTNALCKQLVNDASLKMFLRFVLHTGNYLNQGSNSGTANGFKMTSLNKMVMMKSKNPRITLLHVLLAEVCNKKPEALLFVSSIHSDLQTTTRFSCDIQKSEFTVLKNTASKLQRQVRLADEDIKHQYTTNIKEAVLEIADVEKLFETAERLTNEIEAHYCENEKGFRLHDFLSNFKEFCDSVVKCQKENEEIRKKAVNAEKRKKDLEEKARQIAESGEESNILEDLVILIKHGDKLRHHSVKLKH